MGLFTITPESRANSLDSILSKPINTPFSTIEYSIEAIVEKIKNIDNISDEDIKNLIIHQHNIILNYDLFLMDSETRKAAQNLFTNKRFLNIVTNIIGLVEITYPEKICINKLAYDYYRKENKDQEICDLLYQLTTMVNGKEVTILSGIVGMNAARILAMIKNSTFNDSKSVMRVNNYIVKSDLDLNAQSIIEIYYLFPSFSSLFAYSMVESKPSNLTEFENKKFDAISIAIISMLNSLSSDNMYKVLLNYLYILSNNKYNKSGLRFRLDTIKGYPRVTETVNLVKVNENIKVL